MPKCWILLGAWYELTKRDPDTGRLRPWPVEEVDLSDHQVWEAMRVHATRMFVRKLFEELNTSLHMLSIGEDELFWVMDEEDEDQPADPDELWEEDAPDRWDGDIRKDGKLILPEPGPRITVNWGELLVVEKYLRDIQDGLGRIFAVDAKDHPVPDPDDVSNVGFEASQTLRLAHFLEGQVRGLRTGEWPEKDTPKAMDHWRDLLRHFFPFMYDDKDRDGDDDVEILF
jgi:hypothetical protein